MNARTRVLALVLVTLLASCSDDPSAPKQDPTSRYSRLIGGGRDEYATDVTVTTDGLRVVAGAFDDTLRVSGSSQVLVSVEQTDDIFLTAFRDDGSLAWMKGLGGSGTEQPAAISRDASDNLYIAGAYAGTSTLGTFPLPAADIDAFVAQLDPSGTPIWVVTGGATGIDRCLDVKAGADGFVYFCGDAASEFNIAGEDVGTLSGRRSAFIVRVLAGGGSGRAQVIDGTGEVISSGLALTDAGGAYMCGHYSDGNVEVDGTIISNDGGIDGFVAHFDDDLAGDAVIHIGGDGDANVEGIVALGNTAVVTGYFLGAVDFDVSSPSGNVTSQGGSYDMFVARYNADGTLIWVKTFGGTDDETGSRIARTQSGRLLVVGLFYGDTLTFGVINLQNNGAADQFLVELDSEGRAVSALRIGGPNEENSVSSVAAAGDQAIVIGSGEGDILFPDGTVRTTVETDAFIFQR